MSLIDYKKTNYPTYDIDLNAPPEERWNEFCLEEEANMRALLEDVFAYYRDDLDASKKALLPKPLQPLLKDGKLSSHLIGLLIAKIAKLFGQEYVKELQGIAKATRLPMGHLILANMMYDLQYWTGVFGLGCSSFSFNLRGAPVLARNMDWAIPDTIGKHTRLIRFHRGNSHYESVSVLGSVGVLSAMCPGKWAMTLNMAPHMGAIAKFQTPVMHRIRAVCDELGSYRNSVAELQALKTHSPFFMHVVGTQPKEHCVITGQVTEFDIRMIERKSCLIQTNHYLDDEDLEEHNPSGESLEEDGCEYYEDTFERYDSLEDELRKKPTSLKASMEILSRGAVCRSDTQHSMVFCPKTGSSSVSLRLSVFDESELKSANQEVVDELKRFGFYKYRVAKPKVQLVEPGESYGYHSNDRAGMISVPRLPSVGLQRAFPSYKNVCPPRSSLLDEPCDEIHKVLVDFLRYEHACALIDKYVDWLSRSRKFSEAFGSRLSWPERNQSKDLFERISLNEMTTGERLAHQIRLHLGMEGGIHYNYKRRPEEKFVYFFRKAIQDGKAKS